MVCAPMAGAAGGRLAGAVSGAGGLGMVGVGYAADGDWITEQLAVAAVAGKPVGIGFILWVLEQNPDWLDAALAAGAALVSLSFGAPDPWVGLVHEAGSFVAVQAGTADEARAAADAGADVIVVRGSEGGGHGRGEVGTLPLLQEVLEFADSPVLAAGGVATARGLAAVLAAGAEGAWVGTPFAACEEADNHPVVKQAIIDAASDSTVHTRVFDIAQGHGWPEPYGGRALANRFTDEWSGREDDLAAVADEMRPQILRARSEADLDMAPVYAGSSAGLVTGLRTAAEVMADFVDYPELLSRAADRAQAQRRGTDSFQERENTSTPS